MSSISIFSAPWAPAIIDRTRKVEAILGQCKGGTIRQNYMVTPSQDTAVVGWLRKQLEPVLKKRGGTFNIEYPVVFVGLTCLGNLVHVEQAKAKGLLQHLIDQASIESGQILWSDLQDYKKKTLEDRRKEDEANRNKVNQQKENQILANVASTLQKEKEKLAQETQELEKSVLKKQKEEAELLRLQREKQAKEDERQLEFLKQQIISSNLQKSLRSSLPKVSKESLKEVTLDKYTTDPAMRMRLCNMMDIFPQTKIPVILEELKKE